jgi:hypothetical protein
MRPSLPLTITAEWGSTVAIDERTRHEMYLGLEDKLGTAVADALMQHLPPVGWADVATKHDLEQLEARIELRFDHVEARLRDHLDARIHAEINRLLLFLFPTMLTGLGLAAVIGRVA